MKRDIDYRKLIIERKEHILKDLNQKVLNRFIDKLYAQEIVIDDLQKKLNTFRKFQNNLCNHNNINNINNNNINYKNKHPTLNIIVPKNSSEFSGTIAFMNKTHHNIKNINKFINVKSSSSFMPPKSNSQWNSNSNINKNRIIKKSVSLGNITNEHAIKHTSRKNSKCNNKHNRINNVSEIKKAILSQTTKNMRSINNNISIPLNTFTKKSINPFAKDNNSLLETSMIGNLSYRSFFNYNNIINTPSARSTSRDNNNNNTMVRNPSRKTQELLDKSYKVVENYEKKSKFNSYSDFMNKASTLKHKHKHKNKK